MFLSLVVSAAVATGGIPLIHKKPEIKLRPVTPMVLARVDGGSVPVTFVLTIKNINDKFWCPGIRWSAGRGNGAFEESDCKPFEETTSQERAQQTYYRTLRLGRGTWEVWVTLTKAEKIIWSGSTKVQIVE